jgi:predicted DNA-binding transcriptional regulator AlpA
MARSRSRMPEPKPRGRSKKSVPQKRQRMDGVPLQAMSVEQFSRAHNINRDTFYELLKRGEAPECMKLGKRRLISFEAAARWRAQREREATEVAASASDQK